MIMVVPSEQIQGAAAEVDSPPEGRHILAELDTVFDRLVEAPSPGAPAFEFASTTEPIDPFPAIDLLPLPITDDQLAELDASWAGLGMDPVLDAQEVPDAELQELLELAAAAISEETATGYNTEPILSDGRDDFQWLLDSLSSISLGAQAGVSMVPDMSLSELVMAHPTTTTGLLDFNHDIKAPWVDPYLTAVSPFDLLNELNDLEETAGAPCEQGAVVLDRYEYLPHDWINHISPVVPLFTQLNSNISEVEMSDPDADDTPDVTMCSPGLEDIDMFPPSAPPSPMLVDQPEVPEAHMCSPAIGNPEVKMEYVDSGHADGCWKDFMSWHQEVTRTMVVPTCYIPPIPQSWFGSSQVTTVVTVSRVGIYLVRTMITHLEQVPTNEGDELREGMQAEENGLAAAEAFLLGMQAEGLLGPAWGDGW
jgi:hypothetical protein